MAEITFVETRKWIADIARENGWKVSGRKIKALASRWLIENDLDLDGEFNASLLHSDIVGEEVVASIMAELRAAHFAETP